jgi:hypothetical protein
LGTTCGARVQALLPLRVSGTDAQGNQRLCARLLLLAGLVERLLQVIHAATLRRQHRARGSSVSVTQAKDVRKRKRAAAPRRPHLHFQAAWHQLLAAARHDTQQHGGKRAREEARAAC